MPRGDAVLCVRNINPSDENSVLHNYYQHDDKATLREHVLNELLLVRISRRHRHCTHSLMLGTRRQWLSKKNCRENILLSENSCFVKKCIIWTRLLLRWMIVGKRINKPSRYVTSHLGKLSLAIPLWIGATITSESWDVNRQAVARCISPGPSRTGKGVVTAGPATFAGPTAVAQKYTLHQNGHLKNPKNFSQNVFPGPAVALDVPALAPYA